MGKFQQSYLRNLHKTTVGIATSIVPSKPIIYSWIPLDLNPPVSELEDPPIPEHTSVAFNPFNIKMDDLVGSYSVPYHDRVTGVMFPGGRPLENQIQNNIYKYYYNAEATTGGYSKELSLMRPVNHTFKSIYKYEKDLLRLWFAMHRGMPGGEGGGINKVHNFGDNYPIDTTIEDAGDAEIVHPNFDSLIPFVFNVRNYPSMRVKVDKNVNITTYNPEIPSKLIFVTKGTTNNTDTTVSVLKPPYINSTTTKYTRVNETELAKKSYAPMDIIYVKYDDPILRYLKHPSAVLSWTKTQYSLRYDGYVHIINYIPRVLIIMPTDNPAYHILNGSGSTLVDINERQISFCRGLDHASWFTHVRDNNDLVK
jgi:hypothetical protein|tara:strand:+ start:8131 stop:9231 length:1101 start_codon:yes stop_codon:yes gene_type:complete